MTIKGDLNCNVLFLLFCACLAVVMTDTTMAGRSELNEPVGGKTDVGASAYLFAYQNTKVF
jgi:hypothetical protein